MPTLRLTLCASTSFSQQGFSPHPGACDDPDRATRRRTTRAIMLQIAAVRANRRRIPGMRRPAAKLAAAMSSGVR